MVPVDTSLGSCSQGSLDGTEVAATAAGDAIPGRYRWTGTAALYCRSAGTKQQRLGPKPPSAAHPVSANPLVPPKYSLVIAC